MSPEVLQMVLLFGGVAAGYVLHYAQSRKAGQTIPQALASAAGLATPASTPTTDPTSVLAAITHKLIDQQTPPVPAAIDPQTQILSMFLPLLQNVMAAKTPAQSAGPGVIVNQQPAPSIPVPPPTSPAPAVNAPDMTIGNGLLLSQFEQMIDAKLAKFGSSPAPSMAIKAAA